MSEWFCNSCGVIQYDEDLGRTPAYHDEPSWRICGYCQSDEITELTPDVAAVELYTMVRHLAKMAFPENEYLQRQYVDRANNLSEWLEEC